MTNYLSVATHPDVAAVEAVLARGGQPALLEWAKRNPGAFYRAWAEIASQDAVGTALQHVSARLGSPSTLQ